MANDGVVELLRRNPTAEEYDAVRELWKRHSMAEDERDLPGLLATLTDDCVYELVSTGHRWESHEGATHFYTGLLGAFPDIDFRLTNIVIGPQGVCEEANVSGIHEREWLGLAPSGERLDWRVVIFFPWDRERRLFRGERVYLAGMPVPSQMFPSGQAKTLPG
jgi:predicted ester cyclase